MKYITYIGSYTDADHADGVRIYESDAETGAFTPLGALNTFESPTFMALNRDCMRLYTVLGRPAFGPAGRNGGVAAFAVKDDKLEFINEIRTGWTIPCHVSLSPDEKALVYAEYACGTPAFAGMPGAVDPHFQVQHVGDGPNKPRQNSAHAHCAVVTPDGKYLLVVDLSLDKVMAYDFANRAQGLKPVPSATIDTSRIAPGAGPRHIVFHPNGRLAFIVFELGNLVEKRSILPEGTLCNSKAAAIHLSPDGSQVLCSNRGHDSITAFNVDVETGRLEWLANTKLDGQYPRDFQFMPGGKFILAGLKESWRLASYAYDARTGKLEEVARRDGIYRPLFFAFKNPR